MNIWASESANNANVAINAVIEVMRANATATSDSNTLVQIAKTARIIEPGTSRTAQNFTVAATSTAVNRGDRLRVRVFADDSTTMGSGFTFNIGYNGTSAAADGDTYVSFTETFSFEGAPSGSVIYLTDTASDVVTGSVTREAWTSRGAGVQTDVTNTTLNVSPPIQVTDTAGGTVVEWFTRQLTAFTLGGMAVANLRAAESATTANASLRCQIARVEADGTSPTVWADWCIAPTGTDRGELTASEVARTANLSGDDLAISDGQRLRIRVYVDDSSAFVKQASQTVTFYYAGTSAAASGDSYVTLPQSVTEYTAPSGTTVIPVGFAVGRDY